MAEELSFSAINDNPQKVRKALQILTSSKPETSSRSTKNSNVHGPSKGEAAVESEESR